MNKQTLSLILAIFSSLLFQVDLTACKCKHLHISSDIQHCTEVLIGTILESSSSPFSGEYEVQVEKSWKGKYERDRITLKGAGNCSYGFKKGKKYLIFSHNGRSTICRNNKLIENDTQELHLTALVDHYSKKPIKSNPLLNDQPTLSDYDLAYLGVKDNITGIQEFSGKRAVFIVADTLATKTDWLKSKGRMNDKSYALKLTAEEKSEFKSSLLFIRASLRPIEYVRKESIDLLRKLKRDI